MSAGLFALLDDVAAIAKTAAASLDDVAAHAAKASAKSAGVLIDDAAVTPRYVVGFAAERELPIIARIARGSFRNKLLYLLPAALALNLVAPWLVTPLLMLGGAYLCFEGTEKILHSIRPHHHDHEGEEPAEESAPVAPHDKAHEDKMVTGAIRTDFILSAEIMAIALNAIPDGPLWQEALTLALVAIAITVGVYGAVALIVKADDVGVALAAREGRLLQGIGRGLVRGMPWLLKLLTVVGTAAMVWVGGGIIVHGLEGFGVHEPGHTIHALAESAGHAFPLGGFTGWLVSALGAGLVGIVLGALLIPLVTKVIAPTWNRIRGKQAAPAAH